MNILITGANGFIGKNLIKKINQEEHNVFLLSSSKIPDFVNIDYKNYKLDLLDFQKSGLKEIHVLLLLGAFIPKSSNQANQLNSISNIESIKDLLINLPVIPKKIIYISTIDVYSDTNKIIDENTETKPTTLYGLTKLFCEEFLKIWTKENNVKLDILRLGHIYGIGEDEYKKLIPTTIKNLINDKPPVILTHGNEKRSFLYIDDCCNAIMKSIGRKGDDKIINIVSNYAYSIKEIINLIIKISKKDINPIIKKSDIKTKDFIFDNSKMRKYLCDEEISLEEGLRAEYDYFCTK